MLLCGGQPSWRPHPTSHGSGALGFMKACASLDLPCSIAGDDKKLSHPGGEPSGAGCRLPAGDFAHASPRLLAILKYCYPSP
jgi:hypothetical protein